MVKVSLVMPVYNEIRFIEKTLESVIGEADEIILSDNASTDGTSDICQSYASRYPEIKYIRQKENIGVINNYIFVFDLPTGEYIRYVGGHDLISRNSTQSMLKIIENSDPSVGLVYPQYHLHIKPDHTIFVYYTNSEDFSNELKSDFPHVRVGNYIKDIHSGRLLYSLHKANIFRDGWNKTGIFQQQLTEIPMTIHALSHWKAVPDLSSVYFEMDNHSSEDHKDIRNAVKTVIDKQKENFGLFSFDLYMVCEAYDFAQKVQPLPATPADYSSEIMNCLLKQCTMELWDGATINNVPPITPGKEAYVKEMFDRVLDYKKQTELIRRKKIFKEKIKQAIIKYVRKIFALLHF
jgi:glycosyltransferase involved in cell wall biosynthesis